MGTMLAAPIVRRKRSGSGTPLFSKPNNGPGRKSNDYFADQASNFAVELTTLLKQKSEGALASGAHDHTARTTSLDFCSQSAEKKCVRLVIFRYYATPLTALWADAVWACGG